jgi:hypothetical protein
MGKLKVNDFTFTKDINIFGDPVLMVLRNKDKKHIISIGHEHIPMMEYQGYDPNDHQQVLNFIERNYPTTLRNVVDNKPKIEKEKPNPNQQNLKL